jgi:hypothetical protein
MSNDNYQAEVREELLADLSIRALAIVRVLQTCLLAKVDRTASPCDSIDLHHLADQLDGFSREVRAVSEKAVDEAWQRECDKTQAR